MLVCGSLRPGVASLCLQSLIIIRPTLPAAGRQLAPGGRQRCQRPVGGRTPTWQELADCEMDRRRGKVERLLAKLRQAVNKAGGGRLALGLARRAALLGCGGQEGEERSEETACKSHWGAGVWHLMVDCSLGLELDQCLVQVYPCQCVDQSNCCNLLLNCGNVVNIRPRVVAAFRGSFSNYLKLVG